MKSKSTILVVDDEKLIRNSISDVLMANGYEVFEACNGKEALEKVESKSPDVILLDINMPEIGGIEFLKRIKEDKNTKLIPIVVITGQNDVDIRVQALKLGADDFLIKPPHVAELTARVSTLVKVKAYNDYMRHYQQILEEEVRNRTKEINEAHEKLRNASLDTIYRLSRAAEYKDEDTSTHLHRISHYTAAIAGKIGMNGDGAEIILYASPMHDIGKLGIPDRILLKPGKLNPDEWEIMKRHTVFGGQILEGSDSDFIGMGKTIALTHHEKWDGTGYPNGLEGKDIPIEGRISALADVFDALTTKRPYKEAFSNEKALDIIQEGRGSHFDPDLVDTFFEIGDEIVEIKNKYSDNGKNVLAVGEDHGMKFYLDHPANEDANG
jgi:putative two-component system response regulator